MSIADEDPVNDSMPSVRIRQHLSRPGPVSAALADHVAEVLRANKYASDDQVEADSRRILDACMEVAMSKLRSEDGSAADRELERLRRTASRWAREGVPIGTINSAVHDGFRIATGMILSSADDSVPVDIAAGVQMLIELLESVTVTVSTAYIEHYRSPYQQHQAAVETIMSALLHGRSAASIARLSGIEIASSYTVLAIALLPHGEQQNRGVDIDVVGRRTLRRVQVVLADLGDHSVLSRLGPAGGTILIPRAPSYEWMRALVTRMSMAAQAPIVAACVEANTEDLPTASGQANALVDLAQRLGRPPGLYRFGDLAYEYQLMQPGPGHDHLVATLEPLRAHPELLRTLRVHLQNELHRQRSARQLHLHANSLDNRLRRIGELTGLNPARPQELATLQAALIAADLSGPARL